MKEITADQVPTDGTNFVTLHEYNGNVWATTYRYREDGQIESYNEGFDGEAEMEWTISFIEIHVKGSKFYIA